MRDDEIDHTTAHAARVYDYLLGGVDHFEVDRQAAEAAAAAHPGGIETSKANVRANRTFLGHAVRLLAGEAGIRQFLDVGTGIPNADNTHAVAQAVAPESRIVYVDNDPTVLAHAETVLTSTDEGAVAYLDGDLRHPDQIIRQARATLDLSRPVAVMLVAILHFIREDDRPEHLVGELLDAVPSGSYLVASHLAKDIQPDEMAELADRLNRQTQERFVMRDHAGVARFFRGLDLVGPGVAPLGEWLPEVAKGPDGPRVVPFYGAIGRKP